MHIIFKDATNLQADYCDTLPPNLGQRPSEKKYSGILSALYFYGLYRNAVYNSYTTKEVSADIRNFNSVYHEKTDSKLSQSKDYQNPIYHYSVAASLATIREWVNMPGIMRCYKMYSQGKLAPIGFVQFRELPNNHVVYIAQIGTDSSYRGQSIGRRLMECVLTHYPENTEFYLVTRSFNIEAIGLYKKRLKFTQMDPAETQKLGYSPELYIGFKHTTSSLELARIKETLIRAEDITPTSTPISQQCRL